MRYDINSWSFLEELFNKDKGIIDLVNKAISIRSKKTVRDSCFNDFMVDICSTLPSEQESISYIDMLKYVAPSEYHDKNEVAELEGAINEVAELEGAINEGAELEGAINEVAVLEGAIIEHLWVNVLAHSPARQYFSKSIQQHDVPSEAKPYLLLYSFNISADWFLYGGVSSYCFVDNKADRETLFNSLQKGYNARYNKWHFYSKWENIKSKLFKVDQLSPEQLYPLTILLIVLKREWCYSIDGKYLGIKAESLTGSINKDNINECLIYTLYKHFEFSDATVKAEIPDKTPNISIHPLIARNIIAAKSYTQLFPIDRQRLNLISPKENYEDIESDIDKIYKNGPKKRLLLDSFFPYTKVRENDVFVPLESSIRLVDKIYLSFQSEKQFRSIYRWPTEDEKFDLIQIEPTKNSQNQYDDNRVIAYRKYLHPSGDFLLVQSKSEAEKQQSIKDAFSDFRHDLKNLMGNESIKNLTEKIISSKDIFEKIYRLKYLLLQFKLNSDDKIVLEELRMYLRELDNDKTIQRFANELSKQIFHLRDSIEEYVINSGPETIKSIDASIYKFEECLPQKLSNSFDECLQKLAQIRYTHDTLCDYINMAGTTSNLQKSTFSLTKFIQDFIRFAHINAHRVSMEFDSNLPEYCISYDKTILKVMLTTIVDNAIKHGFENRGHENPIIKFSIFRKEEYLILKIANNGEPIDILTHDYKTRGIFKGVTGHTGLGGYLVSKYAEQMGGYIDIPIQKNWNTEIDIYIKNSK